jgi:hypothetical protein
MDMNRKFAIAAISHRLLKVVTGNEREMSEFRRGIQSGQSGGDVFGGRGYTIRTCDPLVPNQMLYQTELSPAPKNTETVAETAVRGGQR